MTDGNVNAWSMIAPTEAGFSADLGDSFEIARQAGLLANVHGLVAVRAGNIFFERYLPGSDYVRERPLGIVRFSSETLHDLRSATKTIVGLLYGIALAAGSVPAPNEKLLVNFPEYPEFADDHERQALTVGHALTMTLGTEWDELSLPYSDPRNSEIAMDQAADRYRYVLERLVIEPPGQRWTYNGGATALLARLIAKGTRQSLKEFAREKLFAPLGIDHTEWRCSSDGEPIAASGLRMRPRDLARIGTAVLGGGAWNGRQVIPAEWLRDSFIPRVSLPDGRRYGYHWYLGALPVADGAGGVRWEEMAGAMGNGGQRLFLLPRLDLAVVVTAGNYDVTEQSRVPNAILRDVILPAMQRES
ncbi:serine hydrolase domain-containing protein [Variovorax sp. RB2P76]|uniref:serine hydrolase domain-containing protein n=1 Tax=Variovorax sp. RB2P76 TaxID=3443736 RepID=UPI003F45B2A0